MPLARRTFFPTAAGALGALAVAHESRAAAAANQLEFRGPLGTMMPAAFGPRLPGKASAEYLDVTTLAVSYLTDREKLSRFLPVPFELREPRLTIYYADNREVEWLAGGGYHLLGVDVPVRFNGQVDHIDGSYCLVLWEDDADAITNGRELLGIPKIFAHIEGHKTVRGVWSTSADWRGHKFLDMTIQNLKPLDEQQLAALAKSRAASNWMGWKYMPNTGQPGAAVSHATLVPTSAKPAAAWSGTGTIKWHRVTWEQNPTQAHIINALADLPILEYAPAMIQKGATGLRVPGQPVRELH